MVVMSPPRRTAFPVTARAALTALATGVVAAQLFVTAMLLHIHVGVLATAAIAIAALWGAGLDPRRQTAGRYVRNLAVLAPASFALAALYRAWEIGSPAVIVPMIAGVALFALMDVVLVLLVDAAARQTSVVSTARRALAGDAR